MKSYLKLLMRELIAHQGNLSEYIDSLYSQENYNGSDLNSMFGELMRVGYLKCFFADNKAYNVALTIQGKNLSMAELKLSNKEELLLLIGRIEEIEKLFHIVEGPMKFVEEIHDVPEFQNWNQEIMILLQEIQDRKHNQYIFETIDMCRHWNGWNDKDTFTMLAGRLRSIAKNIENYYDKDDSENMSDAINKPRKHFDVFISHANQDKLAYVDELYNAINKLGIRIFYDKEELEWGDKWKDKILNGVQDSEFAVIVISENFFGREWTERELDEFLNRQDESGQKVILPLLYNIGIDDLQKQYPAVSDIQAISNKDNDVKDITVLLARQLIKRYRG